MSSTAPTTIRPAKLSDISAMARVTAAGYTDDELQGDFLHPKRTDYPEDYLFRWKKELRTLFTHPATRRFVCAQNTTGRIIGVIFVQRKGDGAAKLQARESWSEWAQRQIVTFQNLLVERSWTDKSADAGAMEMLKRNGDEIKHYFEGERKECWLIKCLCIHPGFQGRGLGRLLLLRAVEVAEVEEPNVPVGLISTPMGDRLYEKCGFVEVGRANIGQMASFKGGSIRFYEKHLQRGRKGV